MTKFCELCGKPAVDECVLDDLVVCLECFENEMGLRDAEQTDACLGAEYWKKVL